MPDPHHDHDHDRDHQQEPDAEYLDDDFSHDAEPSPSGWERAMYSEENIRIHRQLRGARRAGDLDPRTPVAHVDARRVARRTRQVNFRTTVAAYDELARAADLLDLTATRLAAVLVRDGVARILREHGEAKRGQRQWP